MTVPLRSFVFSIGRFGFFDFPASGLDSLPLSFCVHVDLLRNKNPYCTAVWWSDDPIGCLI